MILDHTWILLVSNLSLVSSLVAFYRGLYFFSLIPFFVWATSQLFWSNPTKSWRRTLDIVVVQICLWTQTYFAYTNFYYSLFTGLGVLSYPISLYFHSIQKTSICIFFHSLIHIFANIGNVCLYFTYG